MNNYMDIPREPPVSRTFWSSGNDGWWFNDDCVTHLVMVDECVVGGGGKPMRAG